MSNSDRLKHLHTQCLNNLKECYNTPVYDRLQSKQLTYCIHAEDLIRNMGNLITNESKARLLTIAIFMLEDNLKLMRDTEWSLPFYQLRRGLCDWESAADEILHAVIANAHREPQVRLLLAIRLFFQEDYAVSNGQSIGEWTVSIIRQYQHLPYRASYKLRDDTITELNRLAGCATPPPVLDSSYLPALAGYIRNQFSALNIPDKGGFHDSTFILLDRKLKTIKG